MSSAPRQIWHLLYGSGYVLCGKEPHAAIRYDARGLHQTLILVKLVNGITCHDCAMKARNYEAR